MAIDSYGNNIMHQSMMKKKRKQNHSCQFKSISRGQYYQNFFAQQEAAPPIGHYNPKYQSIDKSKKEKLLIMDERRDNEKSAKKLKEYHDSLVNSQRCDKLRRMQNRQKLLLKANINEREMRSLTKAVKEQRSGQRTPIRNENQDMNSKQKQPELEKKKSIDNYEGKDSEEDLRKSHPTIFSMKKPAQLAESQLSKRAESPSRNTDLQFYKINLNKTSIVENFELKEEDINQNMARRTVMGSRATYFRDKTKGNSFQKRDRRTAYSIDQKDSAFSTTIYSHQDPSSALFSAQRIGSAFTNNKKDPSKDGNMVNEMLDTFRPNDGFCLLGKNGIQEEFSIQDITYRTNQQAKGLIAESDFQSTHMNDYNKELNKNTQDKAKKHHEIYRTYYSIQPLQVLTDQNPHLGSHNKAIDMAKTLPRNHEEVKSKYSRKIPSQRAAEAPKTLIYHPKYEAVKERLDKGSLHFDKMISRDKQHKTIYGKGLKELAYSELQSHENTDLTTYYDKFSSARKDKVAIDFNKYQKRDMEYLIKGTEAYQNIIRENERIDYRNMFRLKINKYSKSQGGTRQSRYSSAKKK